MKVREILTDAKTGETIEHWVEMPEQLSEEQLAEKWAIEMAASARAERDKLLAESDWTVLADVFMPEELRSAWRSYRQALRDITSQQCFPTVEWPQKP